MQTCRNQGQGEVEAGVRAGGQETRWRSIDSNLLLDSGQANWEALSHVEGRWGHPSEMRGSLSPSHSTLPRGPPMGTLRCQPCSGYDCTQKEGLLGVCSKDPPSQHPG